MWFTAHKLRMFTTDTVIPLSVRTRIIASAYSESIRSNERQEIFNSHTRVMFWTFGPNHVANCSPISSEVVLSETFSCRHKPMKMFRAKFDTI